MEFNSEKKTEQSSAPNSTAEIKEELSDLKVYRQMTASKNSEIALPGLSIEGISDKKPAVLGKDHLKEQELLRAETYAKKHEQGSTLDRALLTMSVLPSEMSITAKPGQLKFSSNDFSKIAEAIPGAALDPTFRAILTGLKSGNIDGGNVRIEGSVKVPVELDGVTAEAAISNPSFTIVPDANNPKSIKLENIKGVSIGALGVGGDIKQATLTLKEDANGKKSLEIEIPRPEKKKAAPDDVLGQLGQRLGGALNRVALKEKTTISIPLDDPASAAVVERAFSNLRDWTAEKKNPAELAAGIAGVELKTVLGGAFDGINSVSKKGDTLEVNREKITTHEFGGLPIELAQTVKAKIENTEKSLKISGIEGVSMNLPVPAEVARSLGLAQGFKANLKELSISEPDKDGKRILTVKTDSILDSVQIKVDKNLKPVPADDKGNIAIDLTIKNKDLCLPLTVTFNPQQLEKPPANGPDFKISLKGNDANYLKLIESMTGTTIDSPLKEMVSAVSSVSKVGDRISIVRDKSSSHDLGGVVLDASKNIQFKVAADGPAGVKISNIEGINLKLAIQLPQVVKDLGIDPGNEINTNLKTLNLSSPDAQGRRKLLLETNHLMKQVGVVLGPDMKPALDPKGNWYMYGFVDNPVANKQLPLVLRFDKANQLAMSTQELMRIGSQAAWQAKDNGGVEGVGFGLIGVATEAGALALDVKDKAVEVAVAAKDTIVEGAIFVKDVAVEAKNIAVEGAEVVGGVLEDGANAVGGLFKKGWKSIFD